jgi:hypothetical protein
VSSKSDACTHGLPNGVWCPASPFCGCHPDAVAKPMPDPEQFDLWEDQ